MVADTLARSLELRKQVTITFDSLLKFHYETRSRRCTQTQLATFQSNFSLRRANTFHRKNISIRVPSTGKRLCVFTEPGFQRACSVFAARPYFIEHYTIPTTEWLRSTGSHGDAPRSLFSRDTPPPPSALRDLLRFDPGHRFTTCHVSCISRLIYVNCKNWRPNYLHCERLMYQDQKTHSVV